MHSLNQCLLNNAQVPHFSSKELDRLQRSLARGHSSGVTGMWSSGFLSLRLVFFHCPPSMFSSFVIARGGQGHLLSWLPHWPFLWPRPQLLRSIAKTWEWAFDSSKIVGLSWIAAQVQSHPLGGEGMGERRGGTGTGRQHSCVSALWA